MNAVELNSSDGVIHRVPPTTGRCRVTFPTLKRLSVKVATVCIAALLLLATAQAQTLTKVIVLFQQDVSTTEIDAFIAAWDTVGVSTLMRVPLVNGAVLMLPEGVASADLATDPIVSSIEDDQSLQVLTLQGSGEGGAGEGGASTFFEPFTIPSMADRTWGILHLYDLPYDPLFYMDDYKIIDRPNLVSDAIGKTKFIKVAVFDTGIDDNHIKLRRKVKGGIDLINFTSGIPMDDNGHGTHIAGTLTGQAYGVAYEIDLYAVKILDGNAAGESSTLVMALQWAVDNDIDVVNMSVGFREDKPLVHMAIQNAYDAGLIMVAAVGNHSNWEDDGASGEGGAGEGGAGEGGAGEGGAGGELYSVMYPAKYPEVIAVGAMDPYGQIAEFSNTGSETDILAPGVDVVSTTLGGGYGVANGTSMATPHATGTVALMLALALEHGKTLTPADVQQILTDTAYNGTLDLVGALEAITMLP